MFYSPLKVTNVYKLKINECVLMLLLQVVEKLIRGLAMEESKNLFSLFEHNAFTDRALESRVIVADVLAKFERYL